MSHGFTDLPSFASMVVALGLIGCATPSSPRDAPASPTKTEPTTPGPAMPQPMATPTTDAGNPAIVISAAEPTYSMAGSLELKVRYDNRGDTPLELREPAKTWEVQLSVRPEGGPEGTQVPFGTITHTSFGGTHRQVVEEAETITLQPGEEYLFTVDVGARWPELFEPGPVTLRVVDLRHDEPRWSNEVRVHVVYDQASFGQLVMVAANANASLGSRRFAQAWIHRMDPSFQPTPQLPEGEPPLAAERVSAALAWWQAHHDDPVVLSRIEQLNAR